MGTTREHTEQLEAEIRELRAQLAQYQKIARQSEHALASEKERLQALGDNFPTGTMFRFRMDAITGDMSLDYVSATWENTLGITAEATMADIHAVFACVDPDDLPRLMDAINESAHTMCNVDIELGYRHPSGSHRWLHLTSHPHCEGDTIFSDGFVLDITQRKRVEQALIFEKERLQSLGDHFPNGTLFRFQLEAAVLSLPDAPTAWLGHLQLSYASATWEKISNVPLADAMRNAALPFMKIRSDDLAAIIPVMYDCLQTLSSFNVEVRYMYAEDAEMRWLQVSAHPHMEDDLIVCDGFILDITNRKQIESELALYRGDLEQLVKERTEELEATNEELATANEELVAFNEDMGRMNKQLQEEIAARQKIMQQLEDSESKLRNFIEQSFEGILMFDQEGRIVEWNQAIERISGLDREDVIGKLEYELQWQLLPDEERTPQMLEELRRIRFDYIAGGAGQEPLLEQRAVVNARDGIVRYINVSMFPIEMAGSCYFGRIVRDITRPRQIDIELNRYRSQLEQMVEVKTRELTLAKEKAEESDRLKSAFLANISHEVRTPLNGIAGLLNILGSDDQLSDKIRKYIAVINNNSEQLLRLIDDILDVAKIEAKQMTIRLEPFYINELIDELHVFFETHLQKQGKKSVMLVADKGLDDCVVSVDPARLRQVLYNLLGNAAKFTEKGYINFGYHVTDNAMLEFSVEDTGIGISPDKLETIFERFRQVELGSTRRYGGTGLGLTISRSLVQLMGGEMWVTSTAGEGSTFRFTIPRG